VIAEVVAAQMGINTSVVARRYLNYGCYCGPGGSGTPLDDADKYSELLASTISGVSKPFCPRVTSPITQQFEGRISYVMFASRYVTFYQIDKCFVQIYFLLLS